MSLDLFDEPAQVRELTHEERWLAFHRAHPQVYKMLVELARDRKAAGQKHYSINRLFETMRYLKWAAWGDEPFKLNNNYRAFYARLLMLRCPDLDGFFRVRKQISGKRPARDGSTTPDEDWRTDPFWTTLAERP